MLPIKMDDPAQSTDTQALGTALAGYQKQLRTAAFSMQFRGYAPKEVDAVLDQVVTLLGELEVKIQQVSDYERWLKEVARQQVVDAAQREADQLVQTAQASAEQTLKSAQMEAAGVAEEAQRELREARHTCEVSTQEAIRVRTDARIEAEKVRKDAQLAALGIRRDAQLEAQDILRAARDEAGQAARAMEDQRKKFLAGFQQEKLGLNQQLEGLRTVIRQYREKVSRTLEQTLENLRLDQQADDISIDASPFTKQ